MTAASRKLSRLRLLAFFLLMVVGPSGPLHAAEREGLLPAWFPGLAAGMQEAPSLLRDTRLLLHLRTFYRYNEPDRDATQEAWAAGGWLAYRSGWLADTFAIGTTGYLSVPLHAPDDRDGTLLLQPGQDTIAVIGEAWGKLRYGEHVLTGGRQLVDVDYLNPQDNRMIPHTFEAALLSGTLGWLAYDAGYVFAIKPREENAFISMAERAGAADADRGLALVRFRAVPWKPLTVDVSTAYGIDTYNTAFGQVEYTHPLAEEVAVTVGAQYHDQRSVGRELIGAFETWSVGAHARLSVRDASIDVMVHQTGDGADIRARYGFWPGYFGTMINREFNRADETAWGMKVSYEFARLGAPGLAAYFWFVQGTGARDPATGRGAPDVREYDLDVAYTLPGGPLEGLQIRGRVALVDVESTPGLLPDIRLILNWPLPLF
jgi:hypothetical protein